MPIRFDILTLFPQMIEGMITDSILKRAIDKGLIEIHIINFREYSTNKHQTVDDYAYGGGAGMLISVEPIHLAMQDIPQIDTAYKILMSPSGSVYSQKKAELLATQKHIVIICGHYEGIDNRILSYVDEEISIGDYVLTGGEIPACALIDSIARLIPGVIKDESISGESFTMGLLEYPQYTRPPIYDGKTVPNILLSGHHANIKKWQRKESLRKTYLVRPDLLEKSILSVEDWEILEEIKNEENK